MKLPTEKPISHIPTATEKRNAMYWTTRQNQLFKAMEKAERKKDKKLYRYYKVEAERLDKKIASYYAKYGKDDVIEYRKLLEKLTPAQSDLLYRDIQAFANKYPKYAHLMPVRESIYKLNRLEGLQTEILLQQYRMGAVDIDEFDKHLSAMASMGAEGISGYSTLNQAVINKFVGAVWVNGRNFSESIWAYRGKLAGALNNKIRDAIIRGDSYSSMINGIKEYMVNYSRSNAMRLLYTEGSFVMNNATATSFIAMGYDEYQYTAHMDNRTSKVCQDLNGQIFRFEDMAVGVNFPPMHPWCRSSFAVVIPTLAKNDTLEWRPSIIAM